ncbi:MAG TPA: hypothetical protein VJ910_06010 [Desulfuromonadales bacterium]|nr:hypothetical protein [Desulfuromonadales bacterium]
MNYANFVLHFPNSCYRLPSISLRLPMFFRLLPLYLVFVLPLTAAAHVNGHSHLPDLSQGSSRSEAQPPASHAQTSLIEKRPFPAADPEALGSLAAGQQDIRREITRLHREIAVLRAEMAQPGLTEILGGIGYIIGFFGLYAWFRVRRGAPV